MKNKFRFRKNSIVSIIASLAILIIFNALFYSKMPAELPTHWNFQGQADDYGSKFHAMVTIQGFLVLMNLFLCFMLDNDPKNERQNNFLMPSFIAKCQQSFQLTGTFKGKLMTTAQNFTPW